MRLGDNFKLWDMFVFTENVNEGVEKYNDSLERAQLKCHFSGELPSLAFAGIMSNNAPFITIIKQIFMQPFA